MTRLSRALVVLGVLQALGCVACVLLAIWGSDDRWGQTALLLSFTAIATFFAAALT